MTGRDVKKRGVRRPAPTASEGAPPEPLPPGWAAVVEASDAKIEAARVVEPVAGDFLEHPTLGRLEVIRVDDRRIEVRDRTRRHRKLAREHLAFRSAAAASGRRLLDVIVR